MQMQTVIREEPVQNHDFFDSEAHHKAHLNGAEQAAQ